MHYTLDQLHNGEIIPGMPFVYDGEISAEAIDKIMKIRRMERFPLTYSYNPIPNEADCILLCENGNYEIYKPQTITGIPQYSLGYTRCVVAFTMKNGTLTDMRKPTDQEVMICDGAHTWYFVPNVRSRKKKTVSEGEDKEENR